MFEGREYPKSLSEETFNQWLEKGRQSNLGYHYLLVVWNERDSAYQAVYAEKRNEIKDHVSAASVRPT